MFNISSFLPKIIYQGESQFNKNIKIVQTGKNKKLIVNGLVQSFDKDSKFAQDRVWGRLSKCIAKQKPDTKSVLLLGMGAGTMLHYLHKELPNNNISSVSVEIDTTVVELAKEHFDLNSITNNRVVIGDAFEVLANPSNYNLNASFDTIIVDTYLGNQYPENIETETFLQNLMKLASKETFLIFNRVISKEDKTTLELFSKKLEQYIGNLKVEKVKCPVLSDNFLFGGNKK